MTVDADRRTRRRATTPQTAGPATPMPEAGRALEPGLEPELGPEPTLDLSLEPARPATPPPEPSLAPSSTWAAGAAAPAAAPMRRLPVAPGTSLSIGEIDQTVFDCPSCARPLALGTHRCPGCGTHLVRGVTLSKASLFVTAGLAVGLLVGGGAGFLLGARAGAAAAPVVAAAASSSPGAGAGPIGTAGPGASAPPSAPVDATAAPPTPPSDLPPVTRSALVQVAATNDRLAAAGAELRSVLAARPFDASAVAQVLRSISADSVFGGQLAGRVAAWPASAELAVGLRAFYDAVHEAAASGLVASVQNTAAYRTAATAMLKLLDGMAAIDAALQAVADSAGVGLPAATTP
jgi:hypothetical protein